MQTIHKLLYSLTLCLAAACLGAGQGVAQIVPEHTEAVDPTPNSERPDRHAAGRPWEEDVARAAQLMAERAHEQALARLATALASGYPSPMMLMLEQRFYALIEDPVLRPRVYSLIKEHARESSVSLVPKDEPGTPLHLEVMLLDHRNGSPVPGALVELVQADNDGRYMKEPGDMWNPRLFAWVRTGADGRLRLKTVRPGSYRDHLDIQMPGHLHFSIYADGYREYHGEIRFEDDPLVQTEELSTGQGLSAVLAQVEERDGATHAAVEIPLLREPAR